MTFASDPNQLIIVALIFILGLVIGGFMFSGGGRKWKHRYNAEVARRTDLEKSHAQREKEWREQDSLRGAAARHDRGAAGTTDRGAARRDSDGDGVRDVNDRDPVDNRRV